MTLYFFPPKVHFQSEDPLVRQHVNSSGVSAIISFLHILPEELSLLGFLENSHGRIYVMGPLQQRERGVARVAGRGQHGEAWPAGRGVSRATLGKPSPGVLRPFASLRPISPCIGYNDCLPHSSTSRIKRYRKLT